MQITRYACYYGTNALEPLSAFDLAILQGEHYARAEIDWLQNAGTQCIAYLSLGELPAREAAPAWRMTAPEGGPIPHNPRWGTAYLDCRRLAWQDEVLQRRVPEIVQRGFAGLFLDTIDVQDLFPATRPGVVQLAAAFRSCHRSYLPWMPLSSRPSQPTARINPMLPGPGPTCCGPKAKRPNCQ